MVIGVLSTRTHLTPIPCECESTRATRSVVAAAVPFVGNLSLSVGYPVVLRQQVQTKVSVEVAPHAVNVIAVALRGVVLDQERGPLHADSSAVHTESYMEQRRENVSAWLNLGTYRSDASNARRVGSLVQRRRSCRCFGSDRVTRGACGNRRRRRREPPRERGSTSRLTTRCHRLDDSTVGRAICSQNRASCAIVGRCAPGGNLASQRES